MNPTLEQAKELITFCESKNVKMVGFGNFHVEFCGKAHPPIDPIQLTKALADSMPPDEKMLFASTEDPDPSSEAQS